MKLNTKLIKSLAAGAVLAAAATSSFAQLNTTTLTGNGSNQYSFAGSTDEAFAITLSSGDYLFTLDNLTPLGKNVAFEQVWVSFNNDRNPSSPNGNDIGSFMLGATDAGYGSVLVHVTKKTDTIYVDLTGSRLAKGYTGAVTIAAVPEPESLAMMLAGLGLFGAMARRRKIG